VNRFDLHEDVAALVETLMKCIYPSRLRFRLDCGSIFALTLSAKAPTVGGTPRHHPDMTRCFASSEQKYTSHSSIPKSQTRRVYANEKLKILSQRGTRIDEPTAGYCA